MSPYPTIFDPDKSYSYMRGVENLHLEPKYFFQENFKKKLASIGDDYFAGWQERGPRFYEPGQSVIQYLNMRSGSPPFFIDSGHFFYCGHCKKRTSPGMSVDESHRIVDVLCSGCKEIIPRKEIHYMAGGSSLNPKPAEYKVYRNAHLVSLAFTLVSVSLYGNKLQEHFIKGRITLNTKTGQSYYFQLKEKGKRWSSKDNIKAKLMNITYGMVYNFIDFSNMPREILEELSSHIREAKMENTPYPIPDFKSYLGNIIVPSNPIYILTSYNRAPYLDFKIFDQLYDPANRENNLKKISVKVRKVKPFSSAAVKELFEICSIPYKKSLVSIARAKEKGLTLLFTASKHFDKIDNIQKIAASMPLRFIERDGIDLFLEEFIKQNGETIAANKLTPKQTQLAEWVIDLPLIYSAIMRREPEMVVDLTGNVKEIHDRLEIIHGMVRKKPIIFNIPEKKIELLEKDFLGYKFIIAKDSHKLVDVGKDMHICVGSYADRVDKGRCNIVYVMDEQFNYKACIELSPDYKTIFQAKAFANKKPEGDLYDAIINWSSDCRIEINTLDMTQEDEERDELMLA